MNKQAMTREEEIARAIRTIQESQETHRQWAEWQERGGQEPEHIGDAKYHREMVGRYKQVLQVLLVCRQATEKVIQ